MPKTADEYIASADKKLERIRELGAKSEQRWLAIGPKKRLTPEDRMEQRLLSQNELLDRSRGMQLKRAEREKSGMRKGGQVRATGKRTLHKGEMVARKARRTNCRGGGR